MFKYSTIEIKGMTMKYIFRGLVVAELKEDIHGRIVGRDRNYTLKFPDANDCKFIVEDIKYLQTFFERANKIIEGEVPFDEFDNIEVN